MLFPTHSTGAVLSRMCSGENRQELRKQKSSVKICYRIVRRETKLPPVRTCSLQPEAVCCTLPSRRRLMLFPTHSTGAVLSRMCSGENRQELRKQKSSVKICYRIVRRETKLPPVRTCSLQPEAVCCTLPSRRRLMLFPTHSTGAVLSRMCSGENRQELRKQKSSVKICYRIVRRETKLPPVRTCSLQPEAVCCTLPSRRRLMLFPTHSTGAVLSRMCSGENRQELRKQKSSVKICYRIVRRETKLPPVRTCSLQPEAVCCTLPSRRRLMLFPTHSTGAVLSRMCSGENRQELRKQKSSVKICYSYAFNQSELFAVKLNSRQSAPARFSLRQSAVRFHHVDG
ncbi:uncharacterized protein LOC125154806 [Prionailurus viverrinus]|uniref:uncharacterized protein LOC125154806 n=1 Tax=Prionailurus viverrinus TaxID=61388 RepID=UPI001FF1D416|nr:uncharacterized protein LOC125154806 [Prionailurus viverrinus]